MFKTKLLGSSKEIFYTLDESMHLQPASKHMPEWFKKMPADVDDKSKGYFPDTGKKLIPNGRTVKRCPSFVDVFKQGYVFVAPCDWWFGVDEYGDMWWKSANEKFYLESHHPNQFQALVPESGVKIVYKIVNTLQLIGPKGWSVWQMPMMYHYKQSQDWYVPYGIIDIDVHHEINPQIFIVSDKKEILIKKGTPLCYIVPFKREHTRIKMVEWAGKFAKKALLSESKTFNSFKSSYAKKRNEANK